MSETGYAFVAGLVLLRSAAGAQTPVHIQVKAEVRLRLARRMSQRHEHLASALRRRTSDRPDFMVLSYPVISMKDLYAHKASRQMLLGDKPDPALADLLSDETQVTGQTPTTFLYATTDGSFSNSCTS